MSNTAMLIFAPMLTTLVGAISGLFAALMLSTRNQVHRLEKEVERLNSKNDTLVLAQTQSAASGAQLVRWLNHFKFMSGGDDDPTERFARRPARERVDELP